MRVLLINIKTSESIYNDMPLGLCYIAAALEKNGFEVKILDLNTIHNDDDYISSIVIEYEMVGITVTSFMINEVLQLAREIKTVSPNSEIVLGGLIPVLHIKVS